MVNLRWYQQESIQSIFDYYEAGNTGNPVIALPTGTGKSLVIAGFVQRVMKMWPSQRFIILTHVKELIEQNYGKLIDAWPVAPAGIYSAGLKQKDIIQPIIFGGCASVVNVVEAFGHRDLMFIDEAHLLSPKDGTTYQQIIERLKVINPYLKVIGLTATPYRLGQGMITDDGAFTEIIYDMTGIEGFNRLIADGYLCPLIPKQTNVELDVSNVGMGQNGDYIQSKLQEAVDTSDINKRALTELVANSLNRRSWLVFASGIEHSEHLAESLRSDFGINAVALHSKSKNNREEILRDFKSGKLRCIVNNNILTTGFDYPELDCIGMLRPTVSPGLWVQMLGRGTRPAPGKANCLVMDFAGNTKRLGCINDPIKPRKRGKRAGEAPIKICDLCGVYNHASVRYCANCGYEFPIRSKITKSASVEELIKGSNIVVEWFPVDNVFYSRYTKDGSQDSVKVVYQCGLRSFSEWIHPESDKPFMKHKYHQWWKLRSMNEIPVSIDEFLSRKEYINKPKKVRIWISKKFPEVLSVEM